MVISWKQTWQAVPRLYPSPPLPSSSKSNVSHSRRATAQGLPRERVFGAQIHLSLGPRKIPGRRLCVHYYIRVNIPGICSACTHSSLILPTPILVQSAFGNPPEASVGGAHVILIYIYLAYTRIVVRPAYVSSGVKRMYSYLMLAPAKL